MKKLIVTLGLGLCLTSAFAQSTEQERQAGTKTKSGRMILPQAGDIAIGIDAGSILNYVGNTFNGNINNTHGEEIFRYNDNIFRGPAIYAKYFLTDNSAIRIKLHVGFDSKTRTNFVADDAAKRANPDSKAQVEDSFKDSQSGLGLRVGYEIRRGYGRLQGFYGAEVGLGFRGRSHTFDYGNKLNIDNTTPANTGATSTNFAQIPSTGLSYSNATGGTFNRNQRYLKNDFGSTFQGFIGGFVGVEYFVAPKLSVGGEFGVGIRFSKTGKGKSEVEFVDYKNGEYFLDTREQEIGGVSSFAFDTNYSAALNLTFHF